MPDYSVIELHSDSILFGRDTARCDFELCEPQISSVHTKIVRNADFVSSSHHGHVATVYDLSTNGTFINNKKVGKGKHRPLFDGDEITFIQFAKKDKKTKRERPKISFLFYRNRDADADADDHSLLAKYDLRETIGAGSFATVKLGVCRENGHKFAVKEIDKKKYHQKAKSPKGNKSKTESQSDNGIMNEAEILQKVSHPNIIRIFDVFDEKDKIYIVLEMAEGGELFQRIIDEKRLSEGTARYVLKQLLSAIMYLHEKKIAHRDLKPENILMAREGSWDIKITDFGLSRLLEYDQMLTTMCGTPMFLAPEVLSSKKRGGYDFSVDYWSIGVVLYLMLVGHPPYNEKDGNLLELVKHGKFSFPMSTWKSVSAEAQDLVRKLMCIDVERRYDGEQVMAHRWMHMGDGADENGEEKAAEGDGQQRVPSPRMLSGRKRGRGIGKCEDGDEKGDEVGRLLVPPRKRYKRADGGEVDASKMQMSMDSVHDLTPFDSIIDRKGPRRKECQKQDTTEMKDREQGVDDTKKIELKNAVSMKEMSLD